MRIQSYGRDQVGPTGLDLERRWARDTACPTLPLYNPPPQWYCKTIPPALKLLPVRVETPVLP